MARPVPPRELEFPGSDSFLDVVTNIVGILIILVVIIGVRSRQSGVAVGSTTEADSAARAGLAAAQAEDGAVSSEMARLSRQIESVKKSTEARRQERGMLAALLTSSEMELEARRRQLGSEERAAYDLQSQLGAARGELARLETRTRQVANIRPVVRTIESLPTSLSKTVDGKEMHFQLLQGRIVAVPLDELLEKFKASVREKVGQLSERDEVSATLGPVNGFSLRYVIERYTIPPDVALRTGRSGTTIRLRRWELEPVSKDLGEPADAALAASSKFRARLDRVKPHDTTLTLWVYPDSFDLFRRVRKELHAMGYAVAGRPLPDGVPISGSPEGTKSAAD